MVESVELIDEQTAPAVLAELGLIEYGTPVAVRPLSGGISNVVLAAEWSGGRAVLKQSLPKLRVAADWPFDRARDHQRAALRSSACAESCRPVRCRTVLAHNDEQFLFVMSYAADGGRNWKEELLAGRIDLGAARRAGELLATVHSDRGDGFEDQAPLVQGRVDPYHRAAAAANPEVAEAVLARGRAPAATRQALVLGDWSPKNLLVYPDSVLALDFEVAHCGDPAFDVAFLLSHLVMKSVHLPQHQPQLRQAADAFLAGYRPPSHRTPTSRPSSVACCSRASTASRRPST